MTTAGLAGTSVFSASGPWLPLLCMSFLGLDAEAEPVFPQISTSPLSRTTVTPPEAEPGGRSLVLDLFFFFLKKKNWKPVGLLLKKREDAWLDELKKAPTAGSRAHLPPHPLLYGFTHLKYPLYSPFFIPSSGNFVLFRRRFFSAAPARVASS